MECISTFSHLHVTFLIVFLYVICTVNCHSMDDAKRLLADKKLGYEKNFRPIVNQTNQLEIYTGLELLSIREFDEVKGQLTITAFLTVLWTDEYITWNPVDYGGLDQLVIESDNVWTPNLVLVNNVDKLDKIGDAWHLIRFTPNGFAYYYPGDVFPASCHVDVTYYPYDKHICIFTFAAWAQLEDEIVFTPINEKVMTTYFSENGAWTLKDSSSEYVPNSSLINFSLHLQRKPRFVMVNVIIPIIFMAFLNTMIYAIPVESGERISYSITVLLALAVFLTLVGDNLPKTSSPMSYFGYYLLTVLIISIGITLTTILNVRMYYKHDDDPIPTWIKGFARCLKCECRDKSNKHKHYTGGNKTKSKDEKNKNRTRKQYSDEDENNYSNNVSYIYYDGYREKVKRPATNGRIPYYMSLHSSTVESESMATETKNDSRLGNAKVSWKDVSSAFDKVFFFLSLSIIMTATVVFFVFIYV